MIFGKRRILSILSEERTKDNTNTRLGTGPVYTTKCSRFSNENLRFLFFDSFELTIMRFSHRYKAEKIVRLLSAMIRNNFL